MKRLLTVILMAVLALPFIACSGDHAEDEAPAIYYVKYEAKSRYHFLQSVHVNTENGPKVFSCSTKTFSQTFAPVPKGFAARISVAASASVSIYVCRGEEPFALKATGTDDVSCEIDF